MSYFDRVSRFLVYVACGAAVLMMLHTCVDVAGRYLFGTPVTGTIEVVGYYYMIFVVFLPLAFLEKYDRHIDVDVVMGRAPISLQRISNGVARLLSTAFFGVMCYQSLHAALQSYEIAEIAFGSTQLILWPSRFALPIGYGAIAVASAIRFIREALLGYSVPEEPDDLRIEVE